MPQDNVTPFRRRPPPPKPPRGNALKSHRGKVLLVHALTLVSFAIYLFTRAPLTYLGLAFGIAAIAIAASNRHEGMPWTLTHHEHALRTIVIGAATWTLGSLLAFLPGLALIGFWVSVAVGIWVLIRAGAGLVLGALRRPIPNPKGMLV